MLGAEQEEKQTLNDADSNFGLFAVNFILSALTFMHLDVDSV